MSGGVDVLARGCRERVRVAQRVASLDHRRDPSHLFLRRRLEAVEKREELRTLLLGHRQIRLVLLVIEQLDGPEVFAARHRLLGPAHVAVEAALLLEAATLAPVIAVVVDAGDELPLRRSGSACIGFVCIHWPPMSASCRPGRRATDCRGIAV